MMDVKTFAKDFIISYFKIRGDFFDTAWDFVQDNFEKLSSMTSLSRDMKAIEGTMAFGGNEEKGAVKAILIFADGFKEVDFQGDFFYLCNFSGIYQNLEHQTFGSRF